MNGSAVPAHSAAAAAPLLNGNEAGKACALGKMSDQQQETDATAGPGPSSSSPSSRSRPQHLNLALQPNYLDDPGTVLLPSFRDIRAKTLRALYGIQSGHHHPLQLFVDKSPKGSVDEAIRPLVDLLNAHPAYATLSSCSGRIALFDPSATSSSSAGSADVDASAENAEADASNGAEVTSERDNATGSGKGSGRWALSSHGQIDPQQLIDLLNDNDNLPGTTDDDAAAEATDMRKNAPPTLMFKHEPLLLHVAASTLLRAEKLLSLALALGFRESGIVSTSKRATVAIRGVGLGLTVPLAQRGPLRPSDDYVRSLVGEANQRFVANEDKLRRLYELVERELFVSKTAGCGGDGLDLAKGIAKDNSADMIEYEAVFEPLPKLGLWGHAAVKVLKLDTSSANDFDIDVFGGHGTGPHSGEGAKRSDAVYRIEHAYGRWSSDGDLGRGWERISAMAGPLPDRFETSVINNIHMQHTTLGAREGLAACLLPGFDFDWNQLRRSDHYSDICETLFNMRARLVAIFGGRGSPAQPSNELLVYTKDGYREDMFWRPTDVRGEPPAARWGHTFTALSGKNGRLAVLCGGRTTKGIVPTCHVLTVTPPCYEGARGGISHCHFLWETVKGEVSLFQHVSVRLSQPETDHNQEIVYIFGGNDDPANLFTSDANGNASITTPTSMLLTVDLERSNHSITTLSHGMVEDDQLARIASSGCCIEDGSQSSSLIVVSGGVPSTPNTATSALSLFRAKVEGNKLRLEAIPVKCRLIDGGTSGKIDVGSLVRHTCISLGSNPPSILLAGGGISSFAFGPSFAESYHVTFHPIRRNSSRGNISGLGTKATAPSASLKLPAKSTKESITDVVYVEKPKAKELKNELDEAQLLDKNYRMIPADASSAPLDDASRYIAVPVSAAFAEMSPADAVSFSWFSLIAGRGRQTMPFSTKVLGNRHSTR